MAHGSCHGPFSARASTKVPLHCHLYLQYFTLHLLAYLPSKRGEVRVTQASLTQFNFTTTNNTVNYKLALNITLRNSNKRVGVHYNGIEAIAYYIKKWFSSVRLTPFYQGHKNMSILSPIFEGQQVLSLTDRDLSKFELEKSVGAYSIDVKLSIQIRIKYGKIKTAKFKPRKIDCPLKVYLSTYNGTTAEGFRTTKCGNVHSFLDPDAID
ncbi:hypothetical protein CIPAW_10G009200 [Carya illinoinensis]|uniref:Late embryogenesis abundant protein LEA-2 subgroup domain-containing protein n=1 Tax=Carya illinoinensis TaxID=32201 RepID=A0A8T1P9R9_CARIL|nr:hypothetical protein CIPAW_10G009200 [Carya illinoinensis]